MTPCQQQALVPHIQPAEAQQAGRRGPAEAVQLQRRLDSSSAVAASDSHLKPQREQLQLQGGHSLQREHARGQERQVVSTAAEVASIHTLLERAERLAQAMDRALKQSMHLRQAWLQRWHPPAAANAASSDCGSWCG